MVDSSSFLPANQLFSFLSPDVCYRTRLNKERDKRLNGQVPDLYYEKRAGCTAHPAREIRRRYFQLLACHQFAFDMFQRDIFGFGMSQKVMPTNAMFSAV